MSGVLVDSSVWVDFFRGDAGLRDQLMELADGPGILTCEPVLMEILSGSSGPSIHEVEVFLDGFASLSLRPELDFRLAAGVRRQLRDRGLTIRSGMDALIATVAINHDVTVLHRDADFERIAHVTPLRQERCVAQGG